uniref:Trichohyalin n=1 Tax=Schistosoma mansoni TaxID=6183 RepID=A0A5K4FGZ9_SCHMA
MDFTCEPSAPLRQSQERFRSPDISRRPLGGEALAAHTVKKSRRAKSTESTALDANDPFVKCSDEDKKVNEVLNDESMDKRWSIIAKNYENMSKQEIMNNYRLLMNEKLRLERFLSIMTKNNEMARNRLESDLLDAMMCIEDLKQALEIRLARRRKIDPREAEERRYLIRQNKKLLNQLFESAKKIERLEVTKVEMKEQLELLDFQIVEVENQKAMIEEELRRIPPTLHEGTQTEESSDSRQLICQLKEQLSLLRSDLSNQKAETAAAVAKHIHLDNLIKELRRDNIELRDQLSHVDDAENSLAESDKPIAADVKLLKAQLAEQLERVKDLEEKLNSSRLYSEKLESRVQDLIGKNSCNPSSESVSFEIDHSEQNTTAVLHSMDDTKQVTVSQSQPPLLKTTGAQPKVDDILLQQTIHTFQALLDERDQEISQLKKHIVQNSSNTELTTDINLPKLYESSIQTELNNEQMEKLSNLKDTLNSGGQLLTSEQYETLNNELNETLKTLTNNPDNCNIPSSGQLSSSTNEKEKSSQNYNDLIQTVNKLRKASETIKPMSTSSELKLSDNVDQANPNANNADQKLIENLHCQIESLKQEIKRLQRGASTVEERTVNGNAGEFHTSHSSPSHFYSMDPYGNVDKQNEEKSNSLHNPSYYSAQLQELRQTGDLELVRAHLSLSERRRRELERRITELTDELARSRAEARSAETSLSAARRTEAALRRRLLVAMDSRGSPNGNYEMNISRNSHEFSTNESSETMNALELQADIIKLQATNASLTEAALLDRTRLHDQAMRIDQLESEHKALLDRVSCLQAAETGAQRGIVRLQALYEDMLREYSESKPLELSNVRGRNRQRSSSRNSRNNDFITNTSYNDKYRATSRNHDIRVTEQQIPEVQAMNSTSKRSIYENSGEIVTASSTTIPVGSCNSPVCIAVRNLLKAFQDRYSDLMDQFIQIQHNPTITNGHLDEMNNNTHSDNNSIVLRKSSQTPAFIKELYTQLNNISSLLNETNHQMTQNYELNEHIQLCLRLISSLDNWINSCLTQNDMEIAHLRLLITNLQLRNNNNNNNNNLTGIEQNTTIFTSSMNSPGSKDNNEQNKQTFSCSISINKKQDPSKFLLNEQELFNLREKLRLAEAQLQLTSMMQTT